MMCLEVSKLKPTQLGEGAADVAIYKKRWVVFQKLWLLEEGCQFSHSSIFLAPGRWALGTRQLLLLQSLISVPKV